MTHAKYIPTLLWIALISSILLNLGLLHRLNTFRKSSIDLRHVSVLVGSKPPDIFGVKKLFDEGDMVISMIDTSNSDNAIVAFCKEQGSSDVVWNTVIGRSFYSGGITAYRRKEK